MSDLLDLPKIDPALALAAEDPAKKPTMAELAVQPLALMEPDLLALAERYRGVAFDLKTPKGLAAMKAARHDLRENGRFAVQRATADFKTQANAAKRAVDDLAERLVAIVRPQEDDYTKAIEAREAELEAERAEKARLEAERIAKLQAGIATIRSYVQKAAGLPSLRIANGIAQLAAMTFPVEQWAEFAVEAANAQCETLEALRKMHVAALQAEVDKAERERLEAEAAERRAQEPVAAVVKEQPAAHAPPEPAATVTTPGGVVADAHTGEVLHTPEPAAPLAPSNAEKIEQARQIVNDIIAAETVRCRGGQRRRAHHPARAQREAVALTPEQLLRCIRDNVRGDTLRLTRDVGPYEVTTLTFEAQTLFRAVIREFCAANGLAAPKE